MLATATAVNVNTRPPRGLVVFATLIGITSGLGLLGAGLALIASATKEGSSQTSSLGVRLGLGWLAGFFVLGIVASVALVRSEQWARRFCIGAGYIIGYWGTLFVADIAISAVTKERGVAEAIGITVSSYITVLGFASALYLLKPEIAARFGVFADNEPRPVAVWTVGWMLLAGCLTTIPDWAESSPSTFFGAVFWGTPARVADSLWTLAAIVLVIGLFRGTSWAYRSTVVFYLFCMADILVDLTPKARARYHALMLQHKSSEADPRRRLIWLIVSLVVFELAPLFIFLAGQTSYRAWREKHRALAGSALS